MEPGHGGEEAVLRHTVLHRHLVTPATSSGSEKANRSGSLHNLLSPGHLITSCALKRVSVCQSNNIPCQSLALYCADIHVSNTVGFTYTYIDFSAYDVCGTSPKAPYLVLGDIEVIKKAGFTSFVEA
jgi:hypothetical protein